MTHKSTFTAIVPAAGIGKRMQAELPKQYLPLMDKTMLECTLAALYRHPRIDHIVLALSADDHHFSQLPVATAHWLTIVQGGKERADSVLAALATVAADSWVLVHDAARPCIQQQDLDNLLCLADKGENGGILACEVTDTMKRATPQQPTMVVHTEARSNLWHALTPQFFPAGQLRKALSAALTQGQEITDEASAIEWAGGKVQLVKGCASNIKVTRPQDLALAEFYLSQQETTQ